MASSGKIPVPGLGGENPSIRALTTWKTSLFYRRFLDRISQELNQGRAAALSNSGLCPHTSQQECRPLGLCNVAAALGEKTAEGALSAIVTIRVYCVVGPKGVVDDFYLEAF